MGRDKLLLKIFSFFTVNFNIRIAHIGNQFYHMVITDLNNKVEEIYLWQDLHRT